MESLQPGHRLGVYRADSMSGEAKIAALTEAVNNLKSEVNRNSGKLDAFLNSYAQAQINQEARLTALEVKVKHLYKYGPFSLKGASTGLKLTFTISTSGGIMALGWIILKLFGG